MFVFLLLILAGIASMWGYQKLFGTPCGCQ